MSVINYHNRKFSCHAARPTAALFLMAISVPFPAWPYTKDSASLAVTFRRLHDTNHSEWWLLIGLVPIIGMMVLLIFTAQDSQAGANQYGPNPEGWRA